MLTARTLTVDDLDLFTLNVDEFEILDGALRERKTVGGLHGRVGYNIGYRLGLHVVPLGIGHLYTSDTGFIISRDPLAVLRPDLAFVSAHWLTPGLEDRGFMAIVPDLVVEVASPTDRSIDIMAKVERYRQAGGRLLWVVEPRRRTIAVYALGQEPRTLGEDGELVGGDVLPGFRLAIAEIFR